MSKVLYRKATRLVKKQRMPPRVKYPSLFVQSIGMYRIDTLIQCGEQLGGNVKSTVRLETLQSKGHQALTDAVAHWLGY